MLLPGMAADSLSLTAQIIAADEAGIVRALLVEAADALTSQHGAGHWSKVHELPTLRKHQAERAVILVRAGSRAVATLTLSRKKPGFYHQAWFASPRAPAVYLQNMAVLPALQRRGIGTWSLQYAESLARAWGAQ